MNTRRFWLTLPTVLLPYVALFATATIIFSTKHHFFECIMESVFHSNGIFIIVALLIYCVFTTILNLICFISNIRKGWDPLSLAKSAMIVKLIQVPAYILIFILCVLFAISVFTIPFMLCLFLLDCLTLLLTGLSVAAAVINAVRQNVFHIKEVIWTLILQLFFCLDIIAAIMFYIRLRRKCSIEKKNA